jgi:hypothetical protein
METERQVQVSVQQLKNRLSTLMGCQMEPYNNKCALIEDLLACPSDPLENLAEEVIKDKLRFKKASLDQVIDLINEREQVKDNNIASIESELIKVQIELFPYKCIVYPLFPDNKRKSNLERAISELESHRRQEEISCWKDTLKLWLQLIEIITEYRTTLRKAQILTLNEENADL